MDPSTTPTSKRGEGRPTNCKVGETTAKLKEQGKGTPPLGTVGCLTMDTVNGGIIVSSNTRLTARVATRDKAITDRHTWDLHRGSEKDVVPVAHIGVVVGTVTQIETKPIPHGMAGIVLTPDTTAALLTDHPTGRETTTGIDIPTNAIPHSTRTKQMYNKPSSNQLSWGPLADQTQVSNPRTMFRRRAPQLTERKRHTHKEGTRYLETVTITDTEVLGDRPRT